MGTTWAIPVGVLAGICCIMLVVFFLYFPRMWVRGDLADRQRMDAERAERIAAEQQRQPGEVEGEVKNDVELVVRPKPTFKYEPPMY